MNLGWLLLEQKVEMDLAIAGFKALDDKSWPTYLKMRKLKPRKGLRSNDYGPMIDPGNSGSFQEQVANEFNCLPKPLRDEQCIEKFYSKTKKYYLDRSLALSLV